LRFADQSKVDALPERRFASLFFRRVATKSESVHCIHEVKPAEGSVLIFMQIAITPTTETLRPRRIPNHFGLDSALKKALLFLFKSETQSNPYCRRDLPILLGLHVSPRHRYIS